MTKVFSYDKQARSSVWDARVQPQAPRGTRGRRSRRRRVGISPSRHYGFIALGLLVAVGVGQQAGLPLPGIDALVPAKVTATVSRPFSICGSGARVDCIVDGDTFWIGGEKVRIADIDTPEISSPRCAAERRRGEQAKRRLHSLLNAGQIELRRSGSRDRDRYGRLLRTVWRNGRSVGDVLVEEGLAHRWIGFKRSWC